MKIFSVNDSYFILDVEGYSQQQLILIAIVIGLCASGVISIFTFSTHFPEFYFDLQQFIFIAFLISVCITLITLFYLRRQLHIDILHQQISYVRKNILHFERKSYSFSQVNQLVIGNGIRTFRTAHGGGSQPIHSLNISFSDGTIYSFGIDQQKNGNVYDIGKQLSIWTSQPLYEETGGSRFTIFDSAYGIDRISAQKESNYLVWRSQAIWMLIIGWIIIFLILSWYLFPQFIHK